jgi:hypothetical protein
METSKIKNPKPNIPHPNMIGWIYSFADYRQMFDLQDSDLTKRILDYPGGISSFNADLYAKGQQSHVISADVLYHLSPEEIRRKADDIFHQTKLYLQSHPDRLRTSDEQSLANLLKVWEKNKDSFLNDYAEGKRTGRYIYSASSHLPFNNQQFELALCSDLMFNSQAQEEFGPMKIVDELCRVANEVRVFPLLNEKGDITESLGVVMATLHQRNFGVEIREVSYHELKGGNAMLRVWAKECIVENP